MKLVTKILLIVFFTATNLILVHANADSESFVNNTKSFENERASITDPHSILNKTKLNELGNQMLKLNQMGKYDEAITLFEKNDNVVTNYMLYQYGVALENANRSDDAIKYYNYLRNDTLSTPAMLGECRASFGSAKYVESLSLCNEVIKKDPMNLDALLISGVVNIKLNKYDESLQYFNKILSQNETHVDANNNIGYALNLLNRFDEARHHFDTILDKNPNNVSALLNEGISYALEDKHRLAITFFDQVLNIDKFNINALNNRGLSYIELKEYDKAIQNFNTVLELEPNNQIALSNKNNAIVKQFDWKIEFVFWASVIGIGGTIISIVALYYQIKDRRIIKPFDTNLLEIKNNLHILRNNSNKLKEKISDVRNILLGVHQRDTDDDVVNEPKSRSTRHTIILFVVGFGIGIVVYLGLWFGSDYQNSQTPLEVSARVAAVLNFPLVFAMILLLFAITSTASVFYKRASDGGPVIGGLATSMAILELILILSDPRNLPFLDKLGK